MYLHIILIFPPFLLNLIAFEIRFKRIYWILFWSEQMKKLFVLSWRIYLSLLFSKFINSISTVMFSDSVLYVCTFRISYMHSIILKFSKFFLNLPCFSNEKSKISDTRKFNMVSLDFKMLIEKTFYSKIILTLILKSLKHVIVISFISSSKSKLSSCYCIS